MFIKLAGATSLGIFIILGLATPAHAAKVNLTTSSVTLTEGQSQIITVTLDEPIVSSDPDNNMVTLTFASSNPSRLSVTDSPLVIPANQWSNSRTITLVATDDAIVNGDETITVTMSTNSGSEYYNGFSRTISVNVLDNDVATTLPEVGGSFISFGGFLLYALGASIYLVYKHKTY